MNSVGVPTDIDRCGVYPSVLGGIATHPKQEAPTRQQLGSDDAVHRGDASTLVIREHRSLRFADLLC